MHCPKGQDLSRYHQVLQFMNIQRKHPDNKREELALHIANGFNGGIKLATHIMIREQEWVRMRWIPADRKAKWKDVVFEHVGG